MMEMNSTTVLQKLEEMAQTKGRHTNIPIEELSAYLGISVAKLVSILTELEHRDEIIMQISTKGDAHTSELNYTGFVRLTDTPPDEKTDLQ